MLMCPTEIAYILCDLLNLVSYSDFYICQVPANLVLCMNIDTDIYRFLGKKVCDQ